MVIFSLVFVEELLDSLVSVVSGSSEGVEILLCLAGNSMNPARCGDLRFMVKCFIYVYVWG